jgi:hypothetical protein
MPKEEVDLLAGLGSTSSRVDLGAYPNMRGLQMAKYKLVNTLDLGDVLIQTIIWIALVLVTFGLALPFFIYYFFRLIINKTEIHEI